MKQFQDLFLLNENKLEITSLPTGKKKILTLNQFRLLECLMEGKGKKNEIMQHVWEINNIVVSDGSYHQLVFQTRHMLEDIGLSADMIKTLPRHGLKLVNAEQELIIEPTTETRGESLSDERYSIPDCSPEMSSLVMVADEQGDKQQEEQLNRVQKSEMVSETISDPMLIASAANVFLDRKFFALFIGGFIASLLAVYLLLSSYISAIVEMRITAPPLVLSSDGIEIMSKNLDKNSILQGLALVSEWEEKIKGNTSHDFLNGKRGYMEDFVVYKYLCLHDTSKTDNDNLCENYILAY